MSHGQPVAGKGEQPKEGMELVRRSIEALFIELMADQKELAEILAQLHSGKGTAPDNVEEPKGTLVDEVIASIRRNRELAVWMGEMIRDIGKEIAKI